MVCGLLVPLAMICGLLAPLVRMIRRLIPPVGTLACRRPMARTLVLLEGAGIRMGRRWRPLEVVGCRGRGAEAPNEKEFPGGESRDA